MRTFPIRTVSALAAVIIALASLGIAGTGRAGSLDPGDPVMAPMFEPHRADRRAYWLEFRARPDNEFGHL